MRRLASRISSGAKTALDLLADHDTSVDTYRRTFYRIGELLAERLPENQMGHRVMLVCTAEDADYLARGMLDFLATHVGKAPTRVTLACFWHARFAAMKENAQHPGIDIAPIVKRYEEPNDERIDTLIVAKSIISSSCVVRHALLDVIGRKDPKRIFIVAPVILRGAQERLRDEFPVDVGKRFKFFFFAEDDQKDADGNVSPGIGGSVYERLGIKEKGIPLLVQERRASHA